MPPLIPLIMPVQKRRDKNIVFSKVSSSFWNVATRGTPLKRAFMTGADLESSANGVSFRNLVLLGSLSFGVPRDFIPINSGPIPSDDTFISLLAFWNFLALPKT